jgi:predicted permease
MRILLKEIQHCCRALLLSPGFSVVTIIILSLGIGANSTVLSWIDATLLHPIPAVADTRSLVALTKGGTFYSDLSFSYPDYVDLRKATPTLSGLAAFNLRPMQITSTGKPERVWGALVSANYFDLLGIRPFLGRTFLPSEELAPGGAPVVVISYALWKSHFGTDHSILEAKISLNHHPYTIIGIAPPSFQGSQTGIRSDIWIPAMMTDDFAVRRNVIHERGTRWFYLMGRLRPSVTMQQAQPELSRLMQHIAEQYPDVHESRVRISLYPMWRSPLGINRNLYLLLPALLVITGVVLLLTCANVANLLLVRYIGRRREMAIRLSLGASSWRIARLALLESVILSLISGVVATILTLFTAGSLANFMPPTNVPITLNTSVSIRVFILTMTTSFFVGVVFGVLPALHAFRSPAIAMLKEEGTSLSGSLGKARFVNGLVLAQVSLAVPLLICAVLFIRSFNNALRFDPGFNSQNVLLASYDLVAEGYSGADATEFDRRVLAKVENTPGVQSAALSHWVPLTLVWSSSGINPEGYIPSLRESMDVGFAIVSPDYLRTMQIPLLKGREFTPRDNEKSEQVAIVNQALADRYWPHQDPLGKRFSLNLFAEPFIVIGVARNSNYATLGEAPQPFTYIAMFQHYSPFCTIHARVSGSPLNFASTLEGELHELKSDLLLYDVTTLQSRIKLASTNQRIASMLVGVFGLLALIVAGVGIYGVIAYGTQQRIREFGIRVALGAMRRDLCMLVLRHALQITVGGAAIGIVISIACTRFVNMLLFGVAPLEVAPFVLVILVLCVVTLAACYLPIRRVTQIDPMVVLRAE